MSHRKLDSGVQVFGPIREAIEENFEDLHDLDDRVDVLEQTGSGTDPSKLPLAGGTMSGDIDMDGSAVTNQLGMTSDPADAEAQARAFVCGADTTGVLTGGEVTINVDPTKFDVAAGTGIIIDWTGPSAPQRHFVSWDALVAQPIPVPASVFTALYFNTSGTLVTGPGEVPTGNNYRSRIYVQSIIHRAGTVIEDVSPGSNPAYETIAAIYDYIRFLGPLNKGNCFVENGTNLNFNKEIGETALPFINRNNDQQNPTVQTDAAQTPVATFSYSYRNGSGGYTTLLANTVIDPDIVDDGSGTLAVVSNNKFTLQRIYFSPQVQTVTIVVGQSEYTNLTDAVADILLATPDVNPLIANNASFTAVLVVKKGTTDLSDGALADFVCIETL